MPITLTNFILGRMNKSVDERLISSGEYIDALNVRLGSTENTEIGAVENSKGNSLLANLQYGGANLTANARTIGCFEDGINETLYWFVHDENNPNSPSTGVVDMIVSFNTNSNTLIYHVVSTEVLNFNSKYLVTGVSKIENLLFFTDDYNPPRVINVTRNYDEPTGGLDTVLEEEDVSVIVKPPGFEDYTTGQIAPLGSPHVELLQLAGEENYMETRFLSFAYRYRYEDGQYSATSLFSDPAFQPNFFQLSLQNFWNQGMENKYNGCNVTFSTGSKRVKEVDLLYKQSISNVIYVIKRYVKEDQGWANNNFVTIQFTNSEIYTTLGADELLRQYDNVPRLAKAQTIQGNRLVYGNIVDGYDLRKTEEGPFITLDYSLNGISEPIAGEVLDAPVTSTGDDYTIDTVGGPHTEVDSKITFDLAGLDTPIAQNTTISFQFSIQQTTDVFSNCNVNLAGSCAGVTQQQPSPFFISMTFICPQEYQSVEAMLNSQEFKNRIGGSLSQGFGPPNDSYLVQGLYPCNNSALGGTLSDKFYNTAETPMTGTNFTLVTGGITNTCLPVVGTFLDTIPFPTDCGGQQLLNSTTTDATPTFLTDTTVNFNTLSPPIQVGDVVINGSTSQQTTIVQIVSDTELELVLTANNDYAGLDVEDIPYIINAVNSTPVICPAQGFLYTPPAAGGTTFSLQVPATKYFSADGTGSGNYAEAYRYYNFLASGSSAAYALDFETSSLHSNRDYEVGIVYMDEYARASTVLTSTENTVYFKPNTSVFRNKIKVNLNNIPPYWATHYKFVVKPSQGDYNTVFSNVFYQQDGTASGSTGLPVAINNDPGQVWFRLEGQNQNILKTGDVLYVKQDSLGPVLSEAKSVVLDIQSFSGKGITEFSLAGLYMLLKPDGWSIEQDEEANYMYGNMHIQTEVDTTYVWLSVAGTLFGGITPGLLAAINLPAGAEAITTYSVNDANGVPYDIPGGSTIVIKTNTWRGGSDCAKSIYYNKTFTSSTNYPNFHAWAIGDDLQSQMQTNSPGVSNIDGLDISFDPLLQQPIPFNGSEFLPPPSATDNELVAQLGQLSNGRMFFMVGSSLVTCDEVSWDNMGVFYGHLNLEIEVRRTAGVFVFETEPTEPDPNLFFDASNLLEIKSYTPGGQKFHMAKQKFTTTPPAYSLADSLVAQDQTATQPLITILDAYNCYTFGNGVESYRIYDSPITKYFQLGERTLAVSQQDFKEADRFAGMTYSGIYVSSANVNNLNEFNLGLANFKDCETVFGPIQLLHARETDILTLQEDRITYVLADKSLISDATGGGAIVSKPTILGTQIARIEEYGISFNPESFVSWGYDMFFTDAKRGAVINLRGASAKNDQIQVISQANMNSWFRDTFIAQLTTQKLGGYDPYMNEYVLGTNLITVPVPPTIVPCGQRSQHENSEASITYDVNLGLVVGTIDIPYIITSGSINITITWNGATVATVSNATTSGTLTFNKTTNTPTTCNVLITPNEASSYEITVECPPIKNITVIQVVVSSNNYTGESIHTKYQWTDGTTISPFGDISPANLTTIQASAYVSNTGVRSLGVFPYTGTDITLKTEKINTDTFDFNPNYHKFRILSSNTEYLNTAADLQSLLSASSEVSPISNPAPDIYEATETTFSIPDVNNYLYLIWDLRLISSQEVCHCDDPADTIQDVCCTCVVPCKNIFMGPYRDTAQAACTTDVTSPQEGNINVFSFSGNGSIPTIADVVYSTNNCGAPFKTSGFYIVSAVSPSILPKRWIQIGTQGVVIAEGTC